MTSIYLAGPLFCDSEKEYNLKLKRELVKYGFEVVLPQENDLLFDPSRMGDKGYAEESAEKVFRADIALIDRCDILVFNLDGRVPDEGACVELGYAYAKGKKVFALKTDMRVAEFGIDNMMISGMLKGKIARSIGELAEMLR